MLTPSNSKIAVLGLSYVGLPLADVGSCGTGEAAGSLPAADSEIIDSK